MGDSVYLARKGQNPPADFPNPEEVVERLAKRGVASRFAQLALTPADLSPKREKISSCFVGPKEGKMMPADLIAGTNMLSTINLVDLITESDKVISF